MDETILWEYIIGESWLYVAYMGFLIYVLDVVWLFFCNIVFSLGFYLMYAIRVMNPFGSLYKYYEYMPLKSYFEESNSNIIYTTFPLSPIILFKNDHKLVYISMLVTCCLEQTFFKCFYLTISV